MASKATRAQTPKSENSESKNDILWDVAVIGGGPAGMMAAGRAAELGAKVILIEKNDSLGKKLLITGGGRCNVTNGEMSVRHLLAKFKGNDKFLFSAFSQWSVKETLDFFHIKKMPTKEEAEKRIFPATERAQSVWNVLIEYLKEGGVTVLSDSPVVRFVREGDENASSEKTGMIKSVQVKGGTEIRAKSFILATGGKSRPETGSTGDGFNWLKALGHKVSDSEASLVPIAIKDEWVKELSGVSLQNTKINVYQNGVKQVGKAGKILFTHTGLSGPGILNLSKDIGELLKYGKVVVEVDMVPALDYGQLNTRLQEIFKEHCNKLLKNSLSTLVPNALTYVGMGVAGIELDVPCNSVTREQRIALVKFFKHLQMEVKGLLGVDKAIVTSGGVALSEVDFKTMQSRLYPNLYLVGDILDIDRPSGGYSLQLCWTTGFVAGSSAAGMK